MNINTSHFCFRWLWVFTALRTFPMKSFLKPGNIFCLLTYSIPSMVSTTVSIIACRVTTVTSPWPMWRLVNANISVAPYYQRSVPRFFLYLWVTPDLFYKASCLWAIFLHNCHMFFPTCKNWTSLVLQLMNSIVSFKHWTTSITWRIWKCTTFWQNKPTSFNTC